VLLEPQFWQEANCVYKLSVVSRLVSARDSLPDWIAAWWRLGGGTGLSVWDLRIDRFESKLKSMLRLKLCWDARQGLRK
jgi:hypothetical protein